MAEGHGHRLWIIPDGYLASTPEGCTGPTGYFSHESVCILNDGDEPAECVLDLFFEDRPPIKGIAFTVEGERSWHYRMDQCRDNQGNLLPRDTPYSMRLTASRKVVVQYSRLDVTQPNMAFMSVVAWPLEA
ncbi:MAG: hypothetical protein HUU35_14320 [Armatimonadetes bacterium]|nr:hypothetical protein [Armatimonadota bacterium]